MANSPAIQRRYANCVWNFYAIDEETLTQTCQACGQRLNAPPNTTNSKKHLKAKHPDLYEILVQTEQLSEKAAPLNKKRKRLPSEVPTPNEDELAQQLIKTFLEQSILQNGFTHSPRVSPEPVFRKDFITIDDSEQSETDANKLPDTNFGNNALISLYTQQKNTAFAAIQPTISKTPTIPENREGSVLASPVADPPQQSRTLTANMAASTTTKKKNLKKSLTNGSAPSANGTHFQTFVPSTTFADMGGVSEQFLEVLHLSLHMKHPEIHEQLNVQSPTGFLIHGPPGCGKTKFAEAIAGQLELPLMRISSTELIGGVSGESEENIRKVFEQCRQSAPCVLLLDEIDVIAPRRESAQREMERRIVTQLIASLDGLSTSIQQTVNEAEDGSSEQSLLNRVLVIGTTSHLDALDMGLRRVGRFDKEIALGIPDEKARTEILNVVCGKMKLHPDVCLKQLARLTPGYVGADLCALSREASIAAVNRVFDTIVQPSEQKVKISRTAAEVKMEIQNMLTWLSSELPFDSSKMDDLFIEYGDFLRALSVVHPSSKREGFATVPDVSWEDIGALKSVRNELEWTILKPIKQPEDFELLSLNSRPQGVLLCGPPGCGKTLLAKAIANETGMNFISVKGPELLSMYVGESERAVRTVFQRARDSSPCVIFFDEIDALCPRRSNSEQSGSARLVNQMLTEMDGMEVRKQVFLIGATNRPDIVDPAILRPGRLDKVLFVDFPDAADRADILRKTTKNGTKPKISPDVNFDEIANIPSVELYTGADLAALVHEAGVFALRERLDGCNATLTSIHKAHFEMAAKRLKPSVTVDDRQHYKKLREKYCNI